MKAKKKNRFLTFCFSVLPGAGEMYMGFMKMGVSLMMLFFLIIAIPASLGLEVFSLIAIIVWFYGFFHANHLAGLSDEEFNKVEDKYFIWPDTLKNEKDFGKYRKWFGIALILTGAVILWNGVMEICYAYLPKLLYEFLRAIGNYTPRVLVAIALILIGIKMIDGRKKQLAAIEDMWSNTAEENTASENVAGEQLPYNKEV